MPLPHLVDGVRPRVVPAKVQVQGVSRAVDEHRAAPALALWAAAVFRATDAELVAKCLEQRTAVADRHRLAVEFELDGSCSIGAHELAVRSSWKRRKPSQSPAARNAAWVGQVDGSCIL